jgi:hypothetical protein
VKTQRKTVRWTEVEDCLEQGVEPVIELFPERAVFVPKKGPGRPRKRKPGVSRDNYAHYPTHTPSGHRMVCRASGCQKRLKRGDVLVCSKACKRQVREACEVMLSILNGELPPSALPTYMRSDRLRGGFKVTM